MIKRVATPVNLIIKNQNKILLIKRAEKEDRFYGFWSIPGGGPKITETYEEALEREIQEELNCDIKTKKYFKSYYYVVNEELHVRSIYFEGEIEGIIKLNKESLEYKWFTFDEIKTLDLKIAFNQKNILLEYIKSKEQ